MSLLKKTVYLSVVVTVFGFALSKAPTVKVADFSVINAHATNVESAPDVKHRFASADMTAFVHSASITALPNGGAIAAWFAGSREGAADVQIRASQFDPRADEWSQERVLATRIGTQTAVRKHVRKLGNPVIALSPNNRLWLFYVSVSVGGWAGSAVNVMYSDDLGTTWTAPRQLVTTPFFNLSTLVRSTPVFHTDGSIGLPIYHEFMGKFAEYLYLNSNGEVVDKFRISKGKHSLQPTIVAQNGREAVALLRYAGERYHRVLASRTTDSGRHWTEPQPVEPSNPNSSLAAVGRDNGKLLVAMNDLEDGRFRLTLYETDKEMRDWTLISHVDESPDPWGDPIDQTAFHAKIGEAWAARGSTLPQTKHAMLSRVSERMCESGKCRFEYEYPYFTRDTSGRYHLVYSWNDTFIKHVSFSDAWVEGKK
ncbi:sialidase family protein [Pseudomonas sp. S36]|uniref:sialidase family protein n=1 Tax=Pseudomonas sp. S36 TaxID=2767447 RepID=UPI00191180E3|nr:sialidase family protein [Pseudomonas sp. S36]MBK4990623.1 exo-alpha-sialidase [Pseudomonas sp. S36]